MTMPDASPSPLDRVEQWYASRGWRPFAFQREVWDAYRAGESGLIHAATGTGKTLAAWMGPLIEWMEETAQSSKSRVRSSSAPTSYPKRPRRDSAPPLRVLWITPLRALA